MKIRRLILALISCAILIVALVVSVNMAQALPTVGSPAPDFQAMATSGGNLSLADFKGKWLVLYFYPKAFTPGCTSESCSLRDGHAEIQKTGAVILGVSLDSLVTQIEFKKKYNLPFELLADEKKEIAKAYGVLGLLGLYAKRKTFIIDPQGKLAHVIDSVNSGNHDNEVLDVLKRVTAK